MADNPLGGLGGLFGGGLGQALSGLMPQDAPETKLFKATNGKTHLATAIALNLCEKGRHVRFYTATGLANILQEKHQRGTLNSFMASLRRVELLVLDEIGYITLHKEASELLFQIVSECYEQKSLIITSNLEFSQWNTVFGNDKFTAAMIDRLVHHSHILVFSGPGHRLEESMRRQKKGGEAQ